MKMERRGRQRQTPVQSNMRRAQKRQKRFSPLNAIKMGFRESRHLLSRITNLSSGEIYPLDRVKEGGSKRLDIKIK